MPATTPILFFFCKTYTKGTMQFRISHFTARSIPEWGSSSFKINLFQRKLAYNSGQKMVKSRLKNAYYSYSVPSVLLHYVVGNFTRSFKCYLLQLAGSLK